MHSKRLDKRGERQSTFLDVEAAANETHRPHRLSTHEHLLGEPGLANARVAAHEQRYRAPTEDRVQLRLKSPQLFDPPDEL